MSSELDSVSTEEIRLDPIIFENYGECPICCERILNDVHCKNKHVLCASCYLKIKHHAYQVGKIPTCPQCREIMPNQHEFKFYS